MESVNMGSEKLLRAGEEWHNADLELLQRYREVLKRVVNKQLYFYMIPVCASFYHHLWRIFTRISSIESEINAMARTLLGKPDRFDPCIELILRYVTANTAYGWMLLNRYQDEAYNEAVRLAAELTRNKGGDFAEYVKFVVNSFRSSKYDEDLLESGIVLKSLFAADVLRNIYKVDFADAAEFMLMNSIGLDKGFNIGDVLLFRRTTAHILGHSVNVKVINIPWGVRTSRYRGAVKLEF